jgi:hypothetical protein
MRVRPIGKIEPQSDPPERVKCWKCDTRFEVARTITRATCPRCESEVALHRLNLPMMPSGKKKRVGEVRLPKAGVPVLNARSRQLGMTVLENAAENVELPRDRPEEECRKRPGSFPVRHRIDERHQMFRDAEPRMEGVEDGIELPGITLKRLLAAIGLATLVLLLFIFGLEG